MEQPATEYCFLAINWWSTCMTKAEWSGWVQAVGSIAAIVAAAWIASAQHRKAVAADRARRINQLETGARVLHEAGELVRSCRAMATEGRLTYLDLIRIAGQLQAVLDVASRLDLAAMDGYKEVGPFVAGTGAIRTVSDLLQQIPKPNPGEPSPWNWQNDLALQVGDLGDRLNIWAAQLTSITEQKRST